MELTNQLEVIAGGFYVEYFRRYEGKIGSCDVSGNDDCITSHEIIQWKI